MSEELAPLDERQLRFAALGTRVPGGLHALHGRHPELALLREVHARPAERAPHVLGLLAEEELDVRHLLAGGAREEVEGRAAFAAHHGDRGAELELRLLEVARATTC